MDRLKNLFGAGRPGPKPAETPHQGHLIALGAKFARMVVEPGISHAKLTRDHVLWSTNDGGYRIISWGNGVQLKWPDEFQAHVEHLKILHRELGHEATAAFRLGYVYRMGPLGELVFLAVRSRAPLPELKTVPVEITGMWGPPEDGDLGENAILPQERVVTEQENGIRARKEHDCPQALRSFLRLLAHGVAGDNDRLCGVSLFNLATVHADEQAWVRVEGLTRLALILVPDDEEFQKHVLSYHGWARERASGGNQARIEPRLSERSGSTVASILWDIDDMDLATRFATGR